MLISWSIIYDLNLELIVRLDSFLSYSTVSINALIFKLFDIPYYHSGRVISLSIGNGIEVIDGCNILGKLGMYFSFIIAYNGPKNLMFRYLIFGGICLYILNIVRIFVLLIFDAYFIDYYYVLYKNSSYIFFHPFILLMWHKWTQLEKK
tara:strand:+ start:975 stop:1421 length:447 start_codon:yes stop_codon:yes gene_type:complete